MFTSHRDWEVSVNVMNYTGHTLPYSADIRVQRCVERGEHTSVDQTMRRLSVVNPSQQTHQHVSAACINQSVQRSSQEMNI